MASDLPCHHADRYVIYTTLDSTQCIAPRKDGQRCSCRIQDGAFAEAREFLELIQATSPADPERIECIKRYLLVRACLKGWHCRKLDTRHDTLQQLAARYNAAIPFVVRLPSSPPPTPRSKIRSRPHEVEYDRRTGAPIQQYALRSNGAPPPIGGIDGPFVPWAMFPDPVLREILVKPAEGNYKRRGWLYAFVWPAWPAFVKIGYTEDSVSARLRHWDKCHPGLRLVGSIEVDDPVRIEECVHAELHAFRYTIPVCANCVEQKTHIEWFRIAEDKVLQVLYSWRDLGERKRLYGRDLQLELYWKQGLAKVEGLVTAAKLLAAWSGKQERLLEAVRADKTPEKVQDLHAKSQQKAPIQTGPSKMSTVKEAQLQDVKQKAPEKHVTNASIEDVPAKTPQVRKHVEVDQTPATDAAGDVQKNSEQAQLKTKIREEMRRYVEERRQTGGEDTPSEAQLKLEVREKLRKHVEERRQQAEEDKRSADVREQLQKYVKERREKGRDFIPTEAQLEEDVRAKLRQYVDERRQITKKRLESEAMARVQHQQVQPETVNQADEKAASDDIQKDTRPLTGPSRAAEISLQPANHTIKEVRTERMVEPLKAALSIAAMTTVQEVSKSVTKDSTAPVTVDASLLKGKPIVGPSIAATAS